MQIVSLVSWLREIKSIFLGSHRYLSLKRAKSSHCSHSTLQRLRVDYETRYKLRARKTSATLLATIGEWERDREGRLKFPIQKVKVQLRFHEGKTNKNDFANCWQPTQYRARIVTNTSSLADPDWLSCIIYANVIRKCNHKSCGMVQWCNCSMFVPALLLLFQPPH